MIEIIITGYLTSLFVVINERLFKKPMERAINRIESFIRGYFNGHNR